MNPLEENSAAVGNAPLCNSYRQGVKKYSIWWQNLGQRLVQRYAVIYNWNRAGEHGERVSVLENAMGSLMTKNGHKL